MKDPLDFAAYTAECTGHLQEAPSAWWARNWLSARGLKPHIVRDYLLGYDPERRAVVIPYLNALSEVRSIRWRNLRPEGPKYLQPKGESLHLFHVKAVKKPKVWVCEGEFDSMILDQMGFPSVGVPGVNSFKPEWCYLFAYCDQVTVVFDADEPGQEGAGRLTKMLSPYVTKLRMVRLPQGKDVTDLYISDKKSLYELVS